MPAPGRKADKGHRKEPDALSAKVGTRIRELREESGFTFDAFVEETGLGRGFVSEVERGLAVPSLTTLDKIARALDVTIADLVIGDSPREQLFEATRGLTAKDVRALLRELKKADSG